MTETMRTLVENTVQCWGCPVFDRLFQVVSYAAAAVYDRFATLCLVLLCVMIAFYILNAVWNNIKGGMKDPFYGKTVRPVVINALVATAILSMGVMVPRLVTRVTIEPISQIALIYTQSMVNTDNEIVNEHVTYQPMPMNDDGFFRPQLRDTVIMLMKTTITQFQSYMKLGIAVINAAFTWRALLGVGPFIKHIIWLMIGVYLLYGFAKLFVKFCFYFADIIVAMAFFAFFFPLSVAMLTFRGASDVPKWISGVGKDMGLARLKSLINAIIALAAAVITYTVIMVIIAKFFSAPGESAGDLMTMINSGDIFAADLSEDNLATMTIMGTVVLVYIVNFLYDQIPSVTNMILSAFNVGTETSISEQLAANAGQLTRDVAQLAKQTATTIINGGNTKGGTK